MGDQSKESIKQPKGLGTGSQMAMKMLQIQDRNFAKWTGMNPPRWIPLKK